MERNYRDAVHNIIRLDAGSSRGGQIGDRMECMDADVTLADETDQYGLPIPRISFSYGDNEHAMIAHAADFMDQALEAVGAAP